MKTFEYRGFDSEGSSRRGLIDALDEKDARERLSRSGILAERLTSADAMARTSRGGFGASDRALVYRELSALLEAGVTLVRGLEILMESPEAVTGRSVLADARDRVREGASLAAAMEAATGDVRPFELAVIAVGEKAGTLADVLGGLATFLEEQQQVRERVRSALVYPSIVVCFAFLVAVIMLGLVIPSMAKLLEEAQVALPLITRVMMRIGRAVMWTAPALAAAAGCAWAVLARRLKTDPAVAARLDRRLFHLPVLGRGYALLVNMRFARTLAILLRGGVAIVDGLALAGRSTGSRWVAQRVDVESETVRHGSSLADAIRRVGPLSTSLPGWIHTGEASGTLDRMLDHAADRSQHQWNRFVARCLSVLEPALILFVGVLVLLVAVSILLPVLSLNRTLN